VTTLLDEIQFPAKELIVLYHERWEVELTYDEQKNHQDPRRPTKVTHLRSETPAGVVQELYALSLAHFVVRKAIFDAASQQGQDPDRISFTGAIQILRTRLPECPTARLNGIKAWYQTSLMKYRRKKSIHDETESIHELSNMPDANGQQKSRNTTVFRVYANPFTKPLFSNDQRYWA